LLCAGDHRRLKGHGEALLGIDHRAGAFAGVDAAIPHLVLAGQIGCGEQASIVHAAAHMQIGAVVPFAHAFRAHTNADGVEGAERAAADLARRLV